MSDMDDLLNEVAGTAKKPAKTAGKYGSPLNDMGIFNTSKAADKKDGRKAGKYIRKTFTLSPQQIDAIERLAQKFDTSGNDIARWMVDVALEAAANGKKPKLAKVGYRKVYEAD